MFYFFRRPENTDKEKAGKLIQITFISQICMAGERQNKAISSWICSLFAAGFQEMMR